MNNDAPISPTVQPKRKRRGVTPRAPRVIDPGVDKAALFDELSKIMTPPLKKADSK